MITPRDFEFKRWKSGTEYENWVADLLTELQFKANRVGKNDCGVDIIPELRKDIRTRLRSLH